MTKAMKKDGDHEYPAEAYAYVPDKDEPSTWKLRLWEDPEKKETARQVGAAVAALGKGYRGNKVEIPEDDLPKVKAKVRAAWKKVNPDKDESDMPDAIKKSGGILAVMKTWFAGEGWDPNPDNKQAQTFIDSLQDDDYSDAVLAALTAALANTVDSILDDDSVTDKAAQIDQATKDYAERLNAVGVVKAKGELTNTQKQTLASVRKLAEEAVSYTQKSKDGDNPMPTMEELQQQITELTKRAETAESQVEELKKSANGGNKEPEDIFKGMSAEVRKRFEDLEKRAKEAEDIAKREADARLTREFVAKAESFKGLPVEAAEFGKVMKTLAEKAPEEFAQVEELLKKADAAIVQGNLFKEVGKSNGGVTGGAYEQLDAIAKSKVEKNKDLNYNQAFDQAVSENPNLYSQYREEVSR